MEKAVPHNLLVITPMAYSKRAKTPKIACLILNGLAKQKEFTIENDTFESTQEYVYLGQLLMGEPNHKKEIH